MPKSINLSILLLTVVLLLVVGSVALAQDEQPVPVTESPTDEGETVIAPSPEVSAEQEVELDETVTAEDLGVKEPTLLPDSKFYFLKNWSRGIKSFFTFDKVKKAELKLKYSVERLLEVRKLAEKDKEQEVIEKAAEKYEEEIEKIKEAADNIKEKASENTQVDKFVDKIVTHTALHTKILEKLEEQVPPEAFEKINTVRQEHLEKFTEVMNKLEDKKDKLSETLEQEFEELKGSQFKQFKNLEILKQIEEKSPDQAKEAVRKAREGTLLKLKEKLEQIPVETQEKFKDYVEKIQGEAEEKLEIIEDIRTEIKEKVPGIKEKLEEAKEKIIENIREKKEKTGVECPPAPAIKCPKGRMAVGTNEKGCPVLKCIELGEEDVQKIPDSKQACIALWDPVCGIDGKTYSNACWAKVAGIEIAYKGTCEEQWKFIGVIGKFTPEEMPWLTEDPIPERCKYYITTDDGKITKGRIDTTKIGNLENYVGKKVVIYGKRHTGPVLIMCPIAIDAEKIEKYKELGCAKEGEKASMIAGEKQCCPGLKLILVCTEDEKGCACMTYPGGWCTKCGDGICKPPENKCNCSTDCSETGITVISPNGGEEWLRGTMRDITWDPQGADEINIYLVDESQEERACTTNGPCCSTCTNWELIASEISASSSKYSWQIPNDQKVGAKYKFLIRTALVDDCFGDCPSDYSDKYFSIVTVTTTDKPIR